MKTKLILCSVLSALLVTACGSSELNEPESQAVGINTISKFKLSPEDATNIAREIVNDISTSTRSLRTVGSVELINTNKTRSNGSTVPDSSLYLVNFTNNDGFAIVAADKRMPRQFYAMSDEGNLSLRDTISNKALALV